MQEENFLRNARLIKKSLGLTTDEYLDIFQMSKKEAESSILNPHNFPLMKAMDFCEHFELDIVTMFSDLFDVNAFTRNFCKNDIVLPERYSLDKNSRAITLINLIATLDNQNHTWLNELIFRRLQIPRQIIYFPEIPISIKLVMDFFEIAEQFQVNSELLKSAGLQGIINLNNTFHFTDTYKPHENEQKKIRVFYEDFFHQQIEKFDKSFDYKIDRLKKDTLILKCTSRENIKDLYKKSTLSNSTFIQYKSGIASGLSNLLGLHPSSTQILTTEKESGYDLFSIDISKRPSFAG